MNIPQFKSYIDLQDYKSIKKVFDNNYLAEGKLTKEFKESLLKLIGSKYGVFANNGTLALYLSLKALNIKSGDEVIIPNITFIATSNAVEMTGAKPVFVDIQSKDNPSLDLSQIKLNKKTKAIIAVHLFGTAMEGIRELKKFCSKNNIFLIEDSAQALGISDGFKSCGSFGDIGTFSFYADKLITTGEGGFIVTNNKNIYNKLLFLRNQGRIKSGTFIHPEIGYNFRITEMQAALGISQFDKLEKIKKEKINIFKMYKKYLDPKINFLKINERFNYLPFRVVILVKNSQKALKEMEKHGIESRAVFYPLHMQPCYRYLKYKPNLFPNSINFHNHAICLPTWIGLKEKQISYISKIINNFKNN